MNLFITFLLGPGYGHRYDASLDLVLTVRRHNLDDKRRAALRWMWVNNIKEKRHEYLR